MVLCTLLFQELDNGGHFFDSLWVKGEGLLAARTKVGHHFVKVLVCFAGREAKIFGFGLNLALGKEGVELSFLNSKVALPEECWNVIERVHDQQALVVLESRNIFEAAEVRIMHLGRNSV